MNPEVFREYDIRGKVGTDLSDEFVERLSKAVSVYWKDHGVKRVAIGMDARLSSPGYRDILINGINDSGIDVIDLGLAPTPALYYSLFKLGLDGGIEVTGSHNPADNNGFKIACGKKTIFGKEIQKIRSYMEEGASIKGSGRSETYDIIPEYINEIVSRVKTGPRKLKVVIDPGNGVGGYPAMAVLKALDVEVTGICMEPDGSFPNHHPDPTTADGVAMLRSEVLRQKADIGVGYDGDSDRIGVIDALGNVIYGDIITLILARAILKDAPGQKIIGEVKCSQVFFDEVEKAGGLPIMGVVGHSLMKDRLMRENAALAGEMSGHIFFNERWYGFDDAIYATARLIEVLSNQQDPQAVFDGLPKMFNTPEIRVDCPDDIKFKAVEAFKVFAKDAYKDCIDIDGVRCKSDNAWFLVRPSNTQPVIVLRFEAQTEQALDLLKNDTMERLYKIIQDLSKKKQQHL